MIVRRSGFPRHRALRAIALLAFVAGIGAIPGPVRAAAQEPDPAERLQGSVELRDGRVYRGILRIGVSGAAIGDRWTGRLVGGPLPHPDDAVVAPLRTRMRATAARTIDFAGERLTWDVDARNWDRDRLSVPLGLVAAIRPGASGDSVSIRLHSGLVVHALVEPTRLHPDGADSARVVISGEGAAPVEVGWREVAAIELGPPSARARVSTEGAPVEPLERRLRGVVTDGEGREWRGLVSVGSRRALVADTLARAGVGDAPDLRFVPVRVTDPQLGEVRVPGARSRRVRFVDEVPGAADLPGIWSGAEALLAGRVVRRDGSAVEGRLIWDADEAFEWQTLDGAEDDLRLSVAFAAIARVRPEGGDGAAVLLRDGRRFALTESSDVDRRNAGLLVLDADGEAHAVEWGDVAEVVFVGGDSVAMPEAPGIAASPDPHVPVADAYDDAAAATLHAAATARWSEADTSVVRYTAVVKQRTAASLRTPLRDRTLFRSESASRVFWDRTHEPLVQVLGTRAEYPGRETALREGDLAPLDDFVLGNVFDPGGERLFFGFSAGDPETFEASEGTFWIAHPLAPGADTLYRFASRDTITLRLPDGRALATTRLDVIPRVADAHRVSATLWIEPGSGALVRAAYRLSETFDLMREVDEVREAFDEDGPRLLRGAFTPLTLDLDLLVVDYSLWNLSIWMPRSFRFEGRVAVGVIRVPVTFDLAYGVESVVTLADVAAERAAFEAQGGGVVGGGDVAGGQRFASRGEAMAELAELASREAGFDYAPYGDLVDNGMGRSGRYLIPSDPDRLARSPELPSPIGDDSPGFLGNDDAARLADELGELPRPPIPALRWQGGPGLWRYNRVEGSALGARVQATTGVVRVGGAPLDLEATGFLGLADLEPKVRLAAGWGSHRRRVTFGAFRELRAVEPLGRPLGIGNSLNAALFGRDDGEYFLATGFDLDVRPPDAARPDLRVRLYAERHHRLARETRFALVPWISGDDAFRDNLAADRIDEAGAEAVWSPWWGRGVGASGVGLELFTQGGATRTRPGDSLAEGSSSDGYARARLTVRGTLALSQGWRVALEGAAGQGWGAVPLQRAWVLGGPATLRGHAGAAAIGRTMGRARLEVGRGTDGGSWAVFGDAGWAGEAGSFAGDDVLWAVGIGGSLLEGLVRADLSRGLTGAPSRQWRFDLYLDGIL